MMLLAEKRLALIGGKLDDRIVEWAGGEYCLKMAED